jgi:hypothetical protein
MLVQERVVLLRATSLKDALLRGAKEADAYCADSEHLNLYGQTVRMRRVDVLESSHLFIGLDAKRQEVWSSTRVLPASVTDQELELMRFGPNESVPDVRNRKKYLDPAILQLVRERGQKGKKS